MKTIKKLSGLELHELICLCSNLNGKIAKYSHVSELLPLNITRNIDSYYDKLVAEYDKRQNEL